MNIIRLQRKNLSKASSNLLIIGMTSLLVSILHLWKQKGIIGVVREADSLQSSIDQNSTQVIKRTGKVNNLRVQYSSSKSMSHSRADKRFPTFGTQEFSKKCSWVEDENIKENEEDCIFFLQPNSFDSEGISNWVSLIVVAHLLARQAGCKLMLSYGPNVDIHEVIIPQNISSSSLSRNTYVDSLLAWETEPENFQCTVTNRCIQIRAKGCSWLYDKAFGIPLARVPWYRYPYADKNVTRSTYMDLEKAISGFQLDSGMACSLGSLLQLSPSAAKYERSLFTEILPALHDEEALVISVYIRTGHADFMAKDSNATQKIDFYRSEAVNTLDCAITVENQYLSEYKMKGIHVSRVVWMVVTDSSYIEEMVREEYDGHKVLNNSTSTEFNVVKNDETTETASIKRKILTTSSRGAHTRRAKNDLSTTDFVEGIIDWYLIGESDVVVGRGPSFHITGALRTARPFYKDHCLKPALFSQPV